jgi:hypothetical protein
MTYLDIFVVAFVVALVLAIIWSRGQEHEENQEEEGSFYE